MKFLIVMIFALLTSLFYLSIQSNALLAQPLSSQSCLSREDETCASDESMLFAGVFTNTAVGVSGQITIDLTINADDTLVGNVDFTQFTGGQFACGSGDFEGSKSGETIELTFTSDDPDPACGFFEGVTFTIEAALLNNTIIRGNYSTDTGQQGIVELRRISPNVGVYLPLIRP